MNARPALAVFGIIALLSTAACRQAPAARQNAPVQAPAAQDKDYLSLVISLDTLSSNQYWEVVYREDSLLSQRPDSSAFPWFHYFRARRLYKEDFTDSAQVQYGKMKGDEEVELLRNYMLADVSLRNGMTAQAGIMQQILSDMKTAERLGSRQAFRYYDLMAKAYFQNENPIESLEYAERHFQAHPFRTHPVVMQRHYDISFLLASMTNDFDKMMLYNVQQRKLAEQIKDSVAIARSYDSEAQIFVRRGQYAKAVGASRIFVDYMDRTGRSNDIAYNNLATSFNHNKQPDSAIRYFHKAIAFAQQHSGGKKNPGYYKGLAESFRMKNDNVRALEAIDSAYDIEIREIKEIEAVKIAETREKYEAEKKDRNISDLSNRNALNEKIIRQQRWTLGLATLVFLGVLGFFYFLYRQFRLNERNKLLQSENRRLNMEHKLLQAQLNPHFVFNSIANLQSLIATGDTKESVRYLSSFSGLLRNVLEQNRRDFITLDEEATSLDNYLQLQHMRFAGLFDYTVQTCESLSPEDILVPPMLVQPFVENAIEHGFRNIRYKGILTIGFSISNGQMRITVEDNGQGFTEKVPGGPKKQSLASTILKERLEVLFKSQGQEAGYEIINNADQGGQGILVIISIPVIRD